MFGLSAGAVTSLFAGSTTLVYDGRFLADKVIKLIQNLVLPLGACSNSA